MRIYRNDIFSVGVKSARDFTDYLMMKGVKNPMALTHEEIKPHFIAYQQELMSDTTRLSTAYANRLAELKIKGKRAISAADGEIYLDRFQRREFLSLIALAELMEYSVKHQDEKGYLVYGKALERLSKEGTNIYKAINLSLKHNDLFQVEDEFTPASQNTTPAREINNISVESLCNALAQSPYEYFFHSITNNYETLLAGRKEMAAMNAKKQLLSTNSSATTGDVSHEEVRLQQVALRASISMAGLDNDLNMRRSLLKTIITASGYDPQFLKAVADDREALARTAVGKKLLSDTANKMGLTIEDFVSAQFATDEIQLACKEILQNPTRTAPRGGSGKKLAVDAPVQTHTLRPYV